jgi:hypothetical protein
MTTIFERVDDALNTLSPAIPFAMGAYKSTDALPDTFIAYVLVDDGPEQHADNVEKERSYLVQVTVWSVNGLVSLPGIDAVMSTAGFKKGRERQLPMDPETGHYGLALEFTYF